MTSPVPADDIRRLLGDATAYITPPLPSMDDIRQKGARRRRARRIMVTLGSLTAVSAIGLSTAVLAASGLPSQSHPQASSVTTHQPAIVDRTDLDFQRRIYPYLDMIATAGRNDPKFASVAIDLPMRSVVVYRKGGQPDQRYTAVSNHYRFNLRFGNAIMTASEFVRTVKAELDAQTQFRNAGIVLYKVMQDGYDPVRVYVDKATPRAIEIAAANAPFGSATVVVKQGGRPCPLNLGHKCK
ncbi:MAG: hypothetical protein JWN00_3832 [Actinomycetia bacterium]|nr:hypothetical protein [Actinomycetes bacterium]